MTANERDVLREACLIAACEANEKRNDLDVQRRHAIYRGNFTEAGVLDRRRVHHELRRESFLAMHAKVPGL